MPSQWLPDITKAGENWDALFSSVQRVGYEIFIEAAKSYQIIGWTQRETHDGDGGALWVN